MMISHLHIFLGTKTTIKLATEIHSFIDVPKKLKLTINLYILILFCIKSFHTWIYTLTYNCYC